MSGPACPRCKTWTPGDARGDGTVIVCRVCAARGVHVRLNAPPRRLRLVELPTLLVVALVLFGVGCGPTLATEEIGDSCAAIDGTCEIFDLPICTFAYGSTPTAAFCTRGCASDTECGDGNVCGKPGWLRDPPLICTPSEFCRSWDGGNCNAVGDVTIPQETVGGIVSSGPISR
jgi:hypothetical protein